ncbi:hypothetical protein [Natranaerobius trueperi]|uniref:Uncharacterized protein n=1 Tax=Natranaerobius trueperi TaxID=759412 RepID=A0A226C2F4_9FIRM|nr:hypothetical protein [Natranaerobius trueperi]OWZ84794.1 hypothetical protein CDO51_01900 [Natranaerobius trueperi]
MFYNVIVKAFFLVGFIIVLMSSSLQVFAETEETQLALENDKDLVIILIPGLSLQEAVNEGNLEKLQKFISRGAIGLMNQGVSGRYHPAASYISLGSGVRATTEQDANIVLQKEETNEGVTGQTLYHRHFGKNQIPETSALVPNLPILESSNNKLRHTVNLGSLGHNLQESDTELFYWGNSDTNEIERFGVLTFMNTKGYLDNTIISSEKTLTYSKEHPYGKKTNYDNLKEQLNSNLNSNLDIQIYELGDLWRIKQYSSNLKEDRKLTLKDEAYNEINNILEFIGDYTDTHQVVVLNPVNTVSDYHSGQRLNFFLVSPAEKQGLLTSNTTQRTGIISNLDFAPSLLKHQNNNIPETYLGDVINFNYEEHVAKELTDTKNVFLQIHQNRPLIIQGFILFQIIVILSGLINSLLFNKIIPLVDTLLLSMMVSPLLFLFLGGFPDLEIVKTSIILILGSIAIAIFIQHYFDTKDAVILLALLVSGSLILDTLMGNQLLYKSVLGHDPISGARYYGIGNEFMGILLGSYTLFMLSFAEKNPRLLWSYVPVTIFIVYLFAHPQLGANFGGFISTIGVFVFVILLLRNDFNIKIDIKLILFGGIGIALLAFVLLIILNTRTEVISHLGRTIELVNNQGIQELYNIIIRKVSMNISLIRYSIWSKVLLAFLGVLLTILVFKPTDKINQLKRTSPFIYRAIQANAIGSLLVFLLNDSGVVAAATIMIFVVPPLLLYTTPKKV